jgi:hypothetical protein
MSGKKRPQRKSQAERIPAALVPTVTSVATPADAVKRPTDRLWHVLGVAAAFIGVFIYGCQTVILQKTLDASTVASKNSEAVAQENMKLVQQSIDEAQAANELARQALNASKDTAQKQLRAYIGVEKPDLQRKEFLSGNVDDFVVQTKNFGLTPANNIVTRAHWHKEPILAGQDFAELPANFKFDYPASPIKSIYSLGPSQEVGFNQIPDDSEIDMAKDEYMRKYTTYIYGDITYTDIYNNTHVREFCYIVGMIQPERHVVLVVTTVHNDEYDVK